ncbi:sigma 54-interacting transcriptional regulator [Rummeliibacillus pycnus]|uniref:sigma 54-interacting transcriptional regulator n=1 Tax=Rummeliibacillus pycnus TaxID=101070 RepID=UPI0037CCA07D
MFAVDVEKLRPLATIDIDHLERQQSIAIKDMKEPFLFLKRQGKLESYINMNTLQQDVQQSPHLTVEDLRHYATSLDSICQVDEHLSVKVLFQIIGEPFALVQGVNGDIIGYLRREEMLVELFKQDNQAIDLLKIILTSIPMGIFVVDRSHRIVNYNDASLKMMRLDKEFAENCDAEAIFNRSYLHYVFNTGKTILNQLQIGDDAIVLVDYCPIINFEQVVEGIVIVVQDLPKVEEMATEIEDIKGLNKDLNAILSSIYDEILVVNGRGELIRTSERLIPGVWDTNLNEWIGKSLLALEKEGRYCPNSIGQVLKGKTKVSVVQETKNQRKILSVGNPIFNEQGEITRIVIASRDITESTRLESELQEMRKISAQYKKELDLFKNKERSTEQLIYRSQKMERLVQQAKRIADFSSTVMLYGESGVGKEVIAQVIHQLGHRSEKPFLKLNCGAIPENLLESELFGYTKGSFTGADKNGKIGYFQQAHEGVLFLDEIGEMPLHLQVKLLRVLQEQEIVQIGSTKPIPINVQIIGATNKNLQEMVANGTFREDLYYRLNVIPLHIPPLRERVEDIPVLAFHFLEKLNKRYGKNYTLTPDAINILEFYAWPGNVRELQNMIERLVVSADEPAITSEFVSRFLSLGYTVNHKKPVITRVMPLEEALNDVEEQLIMLAMKQYKTTTRAAKALGISQSSVSRKYQKILQKKYEQ